MNAHMHEIARASKNVKAFFKDMGNEEMTHGLKHLEEIIAAEVRPVRLSFRKCDGDGWKDGKDNALSGLGL